MIDYINREKRINKYKLSDGNIFQIASYKFNYTGMLLYKGDKEKRLSFKEAELLKLFCLNLNNVLTREYILNTIWGNDDYFLGRSMDVYISKLRKHLKDDNAVKIVTFRSRGYMLEINNN
jgi:DNA-binding response OmpR family regulator